MWWRKPTAVANIHFIPQHSGKHGQKVGERWHADIHDTDGNLLFVCHPRGFQSAHAAREAVEALGGRIEIKVGRFSS